MRRECNMKGVSSSQRQLQKNFLKVLFLNGCWTAFVVMPVLVPYFRSRGLSLQEVYSVQALFAFVLIALDLPAGYVADLWGRKTCIVVACVFNGLAFTLL